MTPRLVLLATAAALSVCAVGVLASDQGVRRESVLLGQVVDATSGLPVSGARVQVFSSVGPGESPTPLTTDDAGRFRFDHLIEGRFALRVTRPGYVPGGYGQRSPSDGTTSVDLSEGAAEVRVRLWSVVHITGTVIDDIGEPLVGATVFALGKAASGGAVRWVVKGKAQTDDRGRYRFIDLLPASYLVAVPSVTAWTVQKSALPEGAGSRTYPTVYYPNSPDLSGAVPLELAGGESREDVDLQEAPRGDARALSGTLTGAPNGTQVWLVRDVGSETTELDELMARTDAAGRFRFAGVLPGNYILRARAFPSQAGPGATIPFSLNDRPFRWGSAGTPVPLPPVPDTPTWWADSTVSIAELDPHDVDLTLQMNEGARIHGRVMFDEAATSRFDFASTSVYALPADGSSVVGEPFAPVDATGAFTTAALPPGTYFLSINNLTNGLWAVKSLSCGGRACTDGRVQLGNTGLADAVITITNKLTIVSGHVRDSRSAVDPQKPADFAVSSVFIFPVNHDLWKSFEISSPRFREVRPSRLGAFEIKGLPAGEYYLVATTRFSVDGLWRTTTFLDSLVPLARRITLTDGQARQEALDLK